MILQSMDNKIVVFDAQDRFRIIGKKFRGSWSLFCCFSDNFQAILWLDTPVDWAFRLMVSMLSVVMVLATCASGTGPQASC
jgi:hypothetical protein